jgi:hypothetical protein
MAQVVPNGLTLTFAWQCAFTHGFSPGGTAGWHSGNTIPCVHLFLYMKIV